MPRQISWKTYRKMKERAETSERRCDALEELIVRKTGASSYTHSMIDISKALNSRPDQSVRITNVKTPSNP